MFFASKLDPTNSIIVLLKIFFVGSKGFKFLVDVTMLSPRVNPLGKVILTFPSFGT